VIHPKEVLREECDILAPCATGAIIHSQIIPEFRCRVIAGSANNQLFSEDDDIELKQRGIQWAPDFIINSGGIIDVAEEYLGYNKDKVTRKTENIYNRTLEVLSSAAEKDISNNQAAIEFAQNRIDSIKKIRGTFAGKGTV
jgi:leucine dehydrogenase